jgi:heavy metal sensor kinase
VGLENMNKFYRIYDESGNVGTLSKNLENTTFPLTELAYSRALKGITTYEMFHVDAGYPIRVITMPVMRNNLMVNLVQVGTSLGNVKETLKNLRIFLLAGVPSVLMFTMLIGRFMAQRALKPLAKVTHTAHDIAGGADLSKRIPQPLVQDEVGQLVTTFNEMMTRLENSFKLIRQFSSDASHELRTPLTVLKGQSELSLRKPRTPEEYQEVLSSNLEEINYMSRILEDLFTLSKSDEGMVLLDLRPVDLGPIIEEVCKPAEVLASEKKIKITITGLEPALINGDAFRLRQLTWNLLHNAIKYTPQGGEIKVSLQNVDNSACLTVEDNGIGISQKDQPLIFDRFYRVDKSRSREESGTGLGLSICKFVVESHKGRIEVESEVGQGSKFKVHFPKSQAIE